ELDALVKLLRDPHRVARPEPQPARRVLLEGRRDVGQVGALRAALLLDLEHAISRAFEIAEERVRLILRLDLELGVFLTLDPALDAVEASQEMLVSGTLGELGVDRPRLDGDELADLLLAVDHEAQRHRGDAPRTDALLHLGPQERAEPETHQAV